MNQYQNRLDAAIAAARRAGEYLLSQPAFSVSHKQSNDYVTDCDRGSEALIRDMLLTAFPGDGFLGEEAGESAGQGGRWIVDPIDGTTNFICDLPLYTISIAYEEAGELVVGCVYCPRLDEMFTATKGGGAFLNGKPIQVSSETVLRDAIVAMAFAHRNDEKASRMLRVLPQMRRNFSDLRRLGSAALDLCFTACGRFEAYVELDLNLYDIAAGVLIVKEAGGVVTGWPGDDEENPLLSGNVIACCPQLYQGVHETLVPQSSTDAILVLGHALGADDEPSQDLIRRLDRAAALWHETHAPLVIPCGGRLPGHVHSEAEVMRDGLLQRGVPSGVIRLEDQSRTTIENAVNASRLLAPGARVAVVTSDYHVCRAMEDCTLAGLNVYGVGAFTPCGPYREEQVDAECRLFRRISDYRKNGLSQQDINGIFTGGITQKS